MRIHYLQHVPFEGPGHIQSWATRHAHQLTRTQLFNADRLPKPKAFDGLVVMGGPMGVHDLQDYPWLRKEKRFIQECIDQKKKVLGICMGAQLIADVLGANVISMPEKEIGWFPMQWTEAARIHTLLDFLPYCQTVLHWHGDRFEIPEKAIPLARTECCANQGFLYNNRLMGLQFHLEMTHEGLTELIANSKSELAVAEGRFIQQPEMMLNNDYFDDNHQTMSMLLDRFFTC